MTDLLTYEHRDRVARITLDDGKVNALSIAMLREIHAALDQAEADGAVVLLGGREGFLSAGFDLKVFREEPERLGEMLRLGADLCERLLAFPTPTMIACGGHAIAAGSFLLLATDVRIGAEGPFDIGLNEVRIGLTLPLFVVELARHRLAPAHFDRALVTARMYRPEEAVDPGFLDLAVAPGDLEEAAVAAAGDLAALNPEAHAATKLRVRGAALEALHAAIEAELPPVP
ncbi:MAG TPA: crotonase/enoyl-CoA hydratase family protein [Solirubrobacterales bacterium]|jgi:enoyl-CoA hydratase|nr:crotonase/enoyl-CoA hydratase family protein [Solirubrobacterales bacterium]